MADPTTRHPLRLSVPLALLASACAGPVTSTAVLQQDLRFSCIDPAAAASADRAIQVAEAEARRQGVKPEKCRVQVSEEPGIVNVWFTNPNPGHEWRGCPPGPCSCFEVRLEPGTLQVVGANFSR